MTDITECNGICKALLSGLKHFFDNQVLTDVTLQFGSEGQYSIKAHSLILCASSDFFDNALRKHAFIENQDAKITLPRIEHEEVAQALLACVYGETYSDENRYTNELFFNLDIYAAADYCCLPAVKRQAAQKFGLAAENILDARKRPPHVTKYIGEVFVAAVRKACKETNPANNHDLRLEIARVCRLNHGYLFSDPEFKKMLQESAELAADIASELAEWVYRY